MTEDKNKTVPGLLKEKNPAQIAFYDADEAITYGQWLDQSQRLAGMLHRYGVEPGDRVAVWLPNQRAFVDVFAACAQIGAIMVAVNTRFKTEEVQDIVGRSGANVLITDFGFTTVNFAHILSDCDADALSELRWIISTEPRVSDTTRAVLESLTRRAKVDLTDFAPTSLLPPETRIAAPADSPCIIFTTSGTTRAPKFVLHDQRSLINHGRLVSRAFGFHPESVLLMAPPLCGVFGLAHVCAALIAGCPWVMYPVWDAKTASSAIDNYGVTHFNATDDAIDQLLAQNNRIPAFVTVKFAGTAAFNPALADIVSMADARGLKLVGLYGASEVQALMARQSELAPPAERKLAGGQLVDPDARVRARDPGSGKLCSHGESGELEFFVPNSRMREYFRNPQATAEAVDEEGWYRSGDLGYSQSDTQFVYLERLGDAMRLGGFLTSPLEIESLIQEFDHVEGCQVVLVNTAKGPRAFAFVIASKGTIIDSDAICSAMRGRLASYKMPVAIVPVDRFPVTEGTNAVKIQKHRLRADAQRWINEHGQD